MKRIILPLMLCVLFAACPAYCSTYYVSPTGNDTTGDGSIGNPWKTIPKAVTAASAGDTIYLRGGTHSYTSTISITKNGASGNPITLQAYLDEAAVVDFDGQPYGSSSRGISVSGNYWHLKGFTIQNAGDNGLYIAGSYNIAEQIVSRMNSDSGIQLHEEGSYNLVLNCDSYLNYDAPNNGENADGFAVKSDTIGPGNIFSGCRAWNNADDGFDLYYTQNAIVFEDCWAFRNGENLWGASSWNGDGNGFKLGASSGYHVLIRCVAYDNWHNGIDINGDTLPVEVYNCTVVACGVNFYFDEPVASVLRNNISHQSSVNIDAAVDDQYNSWNGFTVTDGDFVSLDDSGIDGPREADGSLPNLTFLHLATGSDLIDGGIDVGLPYNGSAPDLGCYETGSSPPDAPTGLSATPGDEVVTLDWNDNSEGDLDGYNVYRATVTGGPYTKQNTSLLSSSNYTDNSVTNGTTYYYVVTAVDTSTNESDNSDEVSATPYADTTPPAAPTGLSATAGEGTVSLNWNDNGEGDLDGYNIYRSTVSGGPYTKQNGPLLSSSDYTDNSVTNGTTYYYVVTAVDTSSNESDDSSQVSATPIDQPPAAPTGLAATAGNGTVTLNWNDNGEGDLDGYNIYRSTTSGGYGKLNSSPLGSSDYTDNSVVNGTTYYYVVTAVDIGTNESGASSEVSATPELRTDVEILGDPNWVTGTSHTKESGTSRALIFIAHEESVSGTPTLTSVTYGGQAMTKVIEISAVSGYGNYVAAFILDEPNIAAATSGTFTPTWSGTTSSVAYASVFLGNVDQTALVGASDSAGTTSSTPNPITTSALATDNGDMVIVAATCGNNGSYTLNNGFTEGTDQSVGTNGHTGAAGHKLATGVPETPSATYSSTVNRQVIIGFVVNAQAATGYSNCSEVLAAGYRLAADIDGIGDCYVNYDDLDTFVDYWLNDTCTEPDNCHGADFEPADGVVDLFDFSDFAKQWLMCNDPEGINCVQNW